MKKLKFLILLCFLSVTAFGQIIRPDDPAASAAADSTHLVITATDSLVTNYLTNIATDDDIVINPKGTGGLLSYNPFTVGQNTGTSGQINFVASDNDQGNIAITTGDALTFNDFTAYDIGGNLSVSGSVSIPGLNRGFRLNSSDNWGIFYQTGPFMSIHGADIRFRTTYTGSDIAIITATGLGLFTDPSYPLDVYVNTPSANDTIFRLGTSDDADRFYVDEDGDVAADGGFNFTGASTVTEITSRNSGRWKLLDENPSATNPTVVTHNNAYGMGGASTYLSLIANSVETLRLTSTTATVNGDLDVTGAFDLQVTSPSANDTIFRLGTSDDADRFYVDEDGDVYADGVIYIPAPNYLDVAGAQYKKAAFTGTQARFDFNTASQFYYQAGFDPISVGKPINLYIYGNVDSGNAFNFQTYLSGHELKDTDARQSFIYANPKVNQSGTASIDGIYLNMIGTAFGDGSTGDGNNLANFALDGTSLWRTSTAGNVYQSGWLGIGAEASYPFDLQVTSPSANDTIFRLGTSDDASRFIVDEDGDLTIDGGIDIGGLSTLGGNLTFASNATIASLKTLSINPSSDNGNTLYTYRFTSSASSELTDTDASQAFLQVNPTVNQSGTASYNGLKIVSTETALGDGSTGTGGTNNLMVLGTSVSEDMFKVDNSGNVHSEGEVTMEYKTHLFHYYGDSTISLSYTTSWQHLTNTSNDMWIDDETDGFTISNDTITITGAGDYDFYCMNNHDGDNGETVSIRFYNVTQATGIPVAGAQTMRGANNFGGTIVSGYQDINAGDEIVIQYKGDASGTAVFKSGIIKIYLIHK